MSAPRSGHVTNRRTYRRATARVLLVDPDQRVLLIQDSDPGLAQATFWITPGGGIDPGETALGAAVREVAEETGLTLGAAELVGPIADRTVVHGYSDRIIEQPETYFAAQVPHFVPDGSGLTESERQTLLGYYWWSEPELRDTSEMIWPVGLADVLAAVRNGASWPVKISDAEESTVPAQVS